MNPVIDKAVSLIGGQTETARMISARSGKRLSQKNIWSWINVTGYVPAEFAPFVEALVREKAMDDEDIVTKQQLCPDFPWEMVCASSAA